MSFRGGEHEFAVIRPDTPVSGASTVADKLRLARLRLPPAPLASDGWPACVGRRNR